MSPTFVESTAKADVDVHHQDVREAEKLGVAVDEVVVTRISDEDMMQVSRDCLDIHSRAGFQMVLITLVMGFNMAGFVSLAEMVTRMAFADSRSSVGTVWIGVSYLASTRTTHFTIISAFPTQVSSLEQSMVS